MKSLVLKDLYNIAHNAKSLIFMLLVFACIFIPMYGPGSYIITSAVLCSMMIVTTFHFDEYSKWAKYALVMPVSKKDLVAGKFMTLFLFSLIGVAGGLILTLLGKAVLNTTALQKESVLHLLCMALAGLVISETFGSISIPLVFRFGAEKGRMLLLISFALPAGLFFAAIHFIQLFGITVTERSVYILLGISPILLFLWNYLMYAVSCHIFQNQEL